MSETRKLKPVDFNFIEAQIQAALKARVDAIEAAADAEIKSINDALATALKANAAEQALLRARMETTP